MGQDRKQLDKLLDFVEKLYKDPDNKYFAAGIERMVLNRLAISTNEKIAKIKDALEIRADASIDYSFVKDIFIQNQLVIDNLRMENVLLNLQISEKERYENFCINAFLQVENLLNYYYCEKFNKDINDILVTIETATRQDPHPFKRVKDDPNTGKSHYNYVSDIPISNKIQAFGNQFFPYNAMKKDFTTKNLQELRKLRNDILHRAGARNDIPQNTTNEEKPAPYPTADMFRGTLMRFVKEVKAQLSL